MIEKPDRKHKRFEITDYVSLHPTERSEHAQEYVQELRREDRGSEQNRMTADELELWQSNDIDEGFSR